VITARNLDKRFGGQHAVRDLSFDVLPGQVTGLLGPNGAGKSTTLRLMLELDRGGGQTRFDGRRYREMREPVREIGCVLDARSFHPARTAHAHLRMLAAGPALPVSRVDEVLAQVGLSDVAGQGPGSFSLGMAQRLSLAAALLGDPHTLILDEPANGLDPQGIQWLRRFLRDFAAAGRTVLVSSHLLAEMALMADSVIVIGRGRLIASGGVTDFVERFSHQQVLVRSPQTVRLIGLLRKSFVGIEVSVTDDEEVIVEGLKAPQVGELAAMHGLPLHELTTRTASPEEAFLQATGASEQFQAAR
jgi:ABC-2 type transport system ATP-binding protein